MDLDAQRDLNRGFGDALARAFEFAAVPLVFAGIGLLVDRAVGTTPWIAVSLAVLALVGKTIAWWYQYDAEMRRLEAELPTRRPQPVAPTPRIGPTRLPSAGLPTGITLDGPSPASVSDTPTADEVRS